jgi:hypothetical protein
LSVTDQPLAPLDDMDAAFELPTSISNERLRQLHEVLVARLRRELHDALGQVPSTIQLLVAERTAFNYILIKDKETHAVGDPGGFAHMTAAKEFNAFWLSLADALNKMMLSAKAEFRDNMLRTIGKTINEVLASAIHDPAERAELRDRIATSLAAATA